MANDDIEIAKMFAYGLMNCFRAQYMLDMSKNTPGCVVDPPYNATMCGFNNSPNCVPLDGCGNEMSLLLQFSN